MGFRPLWTGRPARVRPTDWEASESEATDLEASESEATAWEASKMRLAHGRPPKNGAKNSEVHTYHNQGLGGTQGAQRMNLGE